MKKHPKLTWMDKLWKIQIAEPGFSTRIREEPDENGKYPRNYHIYIHEVGLIAYLWYQVYHWYDMRIPIKIPGWQKFIELYKKVTGAEMRAIQPSNDPDFPPARWRDKIVGWEYEQDLRCYERSPHHRHGKHLCLDITEEQYKKMRSKQAEKLDGD